MSLAPVRPDLFTDAAQAGEEIRLRGSRCPDCSRLEFPAAPWCASCGAATTGEELSSEAELVGFTSVQYGPPGARVAVPYTVGVARFGDDLCVMGLMDEAGSELEFGLTVRTVAVPVADDTLTYGFRPSRGITPTI